MIFFFWIRRPTRSTPTATPLPDTTLSRAAGARLECLYTETRGNNKVEIIRERATVAGPHEVLLGSGQTITAGKILIATGAWPIVPHFPGAEHGITSNEVFHLDTLPKRVVIAGAGYIANEFAGIFHQFGAHVTLRSEEHTSELQSLMRISYAVLCLKKTN